MFGLTGIVNLAGTKTPPRQASLATPPQEGNCLALPVSEFDGYENTTPSGFACHPSAGGECHPVRLRRRVQTQCDCSSVSVLGISPPQEGNGPPQRRSIDGFIFQATEGIPSFRSFFVRLSPKANSLNNSLVSHSVS